jgi:pyrophosphatase PpaX
LISGIGTPLDEQLLTHSRTYLGRQIDPKELDQYRAAYKDHNLANHDEVIHTFDGVTDVLEDLRSLGCPMGIVTSKPNDIARRGLRVCGIESFFTFVIGYDDVVNPKPHPEPVLTAIEHMNTTPDNCLFIGDSPHDILSGNRAGCPTGGALWGPFQRAELALVEPSYFFNHINEIPGWVQQSTTA